MIIYRILILCAGNSCRSQLAEGFLKSFGLITGIQTKNSTGGMVEASQFIDTVVAITAVAGFFMLIKLQWIDPVTRISYTVFVITLILITAGMSITAFLSMLRFKLSSPGNS